MNSGTHTQASFEPTKLAVSRLRPHSLRVSLLLWLILPLLPLALLLSVLIYWGAEQAADSAYDRVLRASALAIADRVIIGTDGLEVDVPYAALEMLSSAANDRIFYVVKRLEPQQVITGYETLRTPEAEQWPQENWLAYNQKFRDLELRSLAIRSKAWSAQGPIDFVVAVAETSGERQALARSVLWQGMGLLALIVIAAVAVALIGIHRSLAPLARIEAAIGRRSDRDLRPLSHPAPSEIEPLLSEVNALLERLKLALDSQKRFVSDVSHELRTPLAEIQTKLDRLAAEQPQLAATYQGLKMQVETTKRLTKQLLLLSSIETDAIENESFKRLDLAALLRDIGAKRAAGLMAGGFTPQFDLPHAPVWVMGNALLLERAIANLLDNAVRHGQSPANIDLSLTCQDGAARLSVSNPAATIAPQTLASLTQRFVRHSDHPTSSGLGLAIVLSVCQRHHGDLTLASYDDQFTASMILPLARRDANPPIPSPTKPLATPPNNKETPAS